MPQNYFGSQGGAPHMGWGFPPGSPQYGQAGQQLLMELMRKMREEEARKVAARFPAATQSRRMEGEMRIGAAQEAKAAAKEEEQRRWEQMVAALKAAPTAWRTLPEVGDDAIQFARDAVLRSQASPARDDPSLAALAGELSRDAALPSQARSPISRSQASPARDDPALTAAAADIMARSPWPEARDDEIPSARDALLRSMQPQVNTPFSAMLSTNSTPMVPRTAEEVKQAQRDMIREAARENRIALDQAARGIMPTETIGIKGSSTYEPTQEQLAKQTASLERRAEKRRIGRINVTARKRGVSPAQWAAEQAAAAGKELTASQEDIIHGPGTSAAREAGEAKAKSERIVAQAKSDQVAAMAEDIKLRRAAEATKLAAQENQFNLEMAQRRQQHEESMTEAKNIVALEDRKLDAQVAADTAARAALDKTHRRDLAVAGITAAESEEERKRMASGYGGGDGGQPPWVADEVDSWIGLAREAITDDTEFKRFKTNLYAARHDPVFRGGNWDIVREFVRLYNLPLNTPELGEAPWAKVTPPWWIRKLRGDPGGIPMEQWAPK